MNIKIAQKLNAKLYFLKSMPLVKRLLKNVNYSFLGFKKFLSIVSIIYSMIAGPIIFALVFFLTIYLPTVTKFTKGDSFSSIMFLLFVFFFLPKFLGSELMEPLEEKFIIVKQMKMNPRDFSLGKIISDKIIGLFSKSLVLYLVFGFLLKLDPLIGVNIAIMVTMFSIVMEAIHLYLYKKFNFNMRKFGWFRTIAGIIGVVGSYIIIVFTNLSSSLNFYDFFSNKVMGVIFIMFGIISFIYLYKYDKYWDILNEENKMDSFREWDETFEEIDFIDIKLDEKEFDEKSLRENDNLEKQGYDYLNHIFFKRHKRTVYKPIKIKSIAVVALFIILFMVDKLFFKGIQTTAASTVIEHFTLLILIIYALSNTNSIIKAMFYNCDRSLLRFGFYKEKDIVLKMFVLRLKTILLTNIVPILLLLIGIVQLIYFNLPDKMGALIPIFINTVALTILFSVHYIFMYYILQPFTTGLETKSRIYSTVNFLVYFASFQFVKLSLTAKTMFPYILVISTIYVFLALILVYTKAPKTFRVK